MPIPELNENNFLPLGEHIVTIEEIHERFAFNEYRERMWNRFLPFIDYIITMNCFQEIVLFGSYFSDKVDPGDIDLALRFNPEDHSANVDPLIFDKEPYKNAYGIDVCVLEPVNEAYRNVAPENHKFHTRTLHFAKIMSGQDALEVGKRTKEFPSDYMSNHVKGVLKIILNPELSE